MSGRLAGAVAVLLSLLGGSAPARADFGLVPDSFQARTIDAAGQPELRAGAHPDHLVTTFAFNTLPDGRADGNAKDLIIDLPTGFAGRPSDIPTCPRTAFNDDRCTPETRVGVMRAVFAGLNSRDVAIYNVAPREDEVAEFGFFAFVVPVRLVIGVRSDTDYGVRIELRGLPQNVPLISGEIDLWGVPADHQPGTSLPRRPLLTNPTSCHPGAVSTTLRVRSWQDPQRWIEATSTSNGPLTGCEQLPFDARLSLGLDVPTADTPTGISVDVTLPQNDDPDGLAASQTHDVTVTLPAGLTLSPGLADGLAVCTDEQLGIGTSDAPRCPMASTIGTVALDTALQPEPLSGTVHLGRPLPGDRFRIFLIAEGRGVVVKLRASLRADPETGQLTLLLADLPALPFDHIGLHFKNGPRALLATPTSCGPGLASADIAPYRGGAPVRAVATVEIVGRAGIPSCAVSAPFSPSFVAGSSPAVGGSTSSFSLTLRRADGEQALDRMRLALPPGLTARLAHVASCPEAVVSSGDCPSDSRVGSVAVEAGAGPSPLPLAGDVYLTGPYAGAPFGLVLVLRAQVGPLDLGTVPVRAALSLDPLDAHLTVDTDPLPQVLAGVPLRLRTLALDIDRPGFMLNPTSCRPTRVAARIGSIDSATARVASRYALSDCRALPFSPTVAVRLGPRELHRGTHPALTINVRSHAGQAALRTATIGFPRMLALHTSAVRQICTQEQARADRCPHGSTVGRARVTTPLLAEALTGSIDVVQPARGDQPELWATVAGMGVRLSVRSTTSAPLGKPISVRFVDVPDMPLSALTLRLRGGQDGLLSFTGDACSQRAARRLVAPAVLRGQNGTHRFMRVRVHANVAC